MQLSKDYLEKRIAALREQEQRLIKGVAQVQGAVAILVDMHASLVKEEQEVAAAAVAEAGKGKRRRKAKPPQHSALEKQVH